jgi:hypothetical protein
MTDKFLFRAGIVAFAILGLAVGAVTIKSPSTTPKAAANDASSTTTAASTWAPQEQVSTIHSSSSAESGPSQTSNLQSSAQTSSPAPALSSSSFPADQPASFTPSSAQIVPGAVRASDLQKLALAVHFTGSQANGLNKDLWARQIPNAEKLLQGICDCEQRNWLNRFITTGNFALAGSVEEYYQSARILATLPKSDVGSPSN